MNVTKFLNEPSQETESSIEDASLINNSYMSSRFLSLDTSKSTKKPIRAEGKSFRTSKNVAGSTSGQHKLLLKALGVREGNTGRTEAAHELTG